MNGRKKTKFFWQDEDFRKVLKYIRKPWLITFAITGAVLVLFVLVLLIIGKLEDFIVYMDLRYNSPAVIGLAVIVLAVQIGALFYGVVLSLKQYKRPGSGLVSHNYKQGSSYTALSGVIRASDEDK